LSTDNDTPFIPDPRIQKFYELAFSPEDAIAIGSHELPNERGRRYMNEHQAALSDMPDYQGEDWRTGGDMFFSVLPMQPYDEQKKDERRWRAQSLAQPGSLLWMDFDEGLNGDLRAEMDELGASIILSGSMNGLLPKAHAYIHLSTAEDPRELVWLSSRLAAKYDADPSCAEAARFLRIPGTLNHKTNPPRPVTLDTLGDPCDIEDVYEYLGIERPDVDDLPELEDTHRATKGEVADFTRRTALLAGSTSGPVKGYITQYNERTTPGVISNRHLAMMAALNWAARESQAGQVCFSDAVDALRNVWRLSLGNDRARIESDEFDEMVEYAVGSLPSSPMDGEGQEISEFITRDVCSQ
jgi:hypothetical protein